ncbi:MAG: hydrogenase expression protein HypE, partial [Proteobacteria bacterium]|nr:hydrogenase expression protein HypE [Pseudomonadota bacterium]
MGADGIARQLAGAASVAGAAGWPRHVVDARAWTAIGDAIAAGEGDLLALWAEPGHVHLAVNAKGLAPPAIVSIAVADGGFPSLGRRHAPALRPERAIRDLFGYVARDSPDARPWLDHGAWGVRAPLTSQAPAAIADPAAYDFQPVRGKGLHQIPVGPVHAGIIEPGHFR